MAKSSPSADFVIKQKIRIKLTGDGTQIGKRLPVINFGFTFLEEGDASYTSTGNHCIAIIKEEENTNLWY